MRKIFIVMIACFLIIISAGCSKKRNPDVIVGDQAYVIGHQVGEISTDVVIETKAIDGKSCVVIDVEDKNSGKYQIAVSNDSEKARDISDCIVEYIHLVESNLKSREKVQLGGFGFDSSISDLNNLFGLYMHRYESSTSQYYYWENENYSVIIRATLASDSLRDGKFTEIIIGQRSNILQKFEEIKTQKEDLSHNKDGQPLAFYANGYRYYFGSTMSNLQKDFQFSNVSPARIKIEPYSYGTYLMNDNNTWFLAVAYNDTNKTIALKDCKFGGFIIGPSNYFETGLLENELTQSTFTFFGDLKIEGFSKDANLKTLVSNLGKYDYKSRAAGDAHSSIYHWLSEKTELRVAYDDHSNEVLSVFVGVRGVVVPDEFNEQLSKNCVVESDGTQFILGEKLITLLDNMVMKESDLLETVSPGDYGTVNLYSYYNEDHKTYVNKFRVVVYNNDKNALPFTGCTIQSIAVEELSNLTKNKTWLKGNLYMHYDLNEMIDVLGHYDAVEQPGLDKYYCWNKDGYVIVAAFQNNKLIRIQYCIPGYFQTVFKNGE